MLTMKLNMKKSSKVLLLSLLVFPGTGHLLLKKYGIASGFIISFAYVLWSMTKQIYIDAQEIIQSMVNNNQLIDIETIKQLLIEKQSLNNSNISVLVYLLLFIWVFAAIDAYRLANKQ